MAAIPVDPREELERLERKHAENPEGRYFVPLADAYRRSGDLSGAIDLLRAGLARHPDYLSAHVVLGRCYADSGDQEGAEAEFRYILSLDPQNLIALRTLGDIALIDGRPGEAERWYQDLLAVDPMNDDARAALRQLQEDEFAAARDEESRAGAIADGGELQLADAAPHEPPAAGANGLDDGLGDMVDLKSDDDRGALFDDDSDVVVTETIAELYTRQGFFDRAGEIYRELIRRRGGDAALEAKLRRVEGLASGAPDHAADLADSPGENRYPVEADSPILEDETPELVEGDAPSADGESFEASDLAGSLYPLIGPVGEGEADHVEAVDRDEPAESQVPPAYDLSEAAEEEPASGTGSDDLDDLLIDPYADPFGSIPSAISTDVSARSFGSNSDGEPNAQDGVIQSGGLGPDPFADSFADGFPTLEEEAPLGDDTVPAAEVAPAGQMAIGAFLKSIATWSRSGSRTGEDSSQVPSDAPSSADLPADSGLSGWAGREDSSGDPGEPDAGRAEDESPAAWTLAEMEFDAAPAHIPTEAGLGEADAPAGTPAEPSGADDLQLVSGVDDLFPWEIPVPEPGSQALPPVQPLDLDPGYPFDETREAEAPFVDDTVRSERTPSDAVEPSESEAIPPGGDSMPRDGKTEAADDVPTPTAEHDPIDGLASPQGDTHDDDDLESFQAWLRSLKR